jgi:predicted acetyltransferase
MDLVLRAPRQSEEAEFLRAHRATSPSVRHFLHYYEEGMSFRRYLEVLAEQERGQNLPANHVPSTFLFAFAGTRIVGRVSIRHCLNPYLERVGGHIGYVVVPEYRRQGYATAILRQSLQIARQKLGLKRVLVTCDDDIYPGVGGKRRDRMNVLLWVLQVLLALAFFAHGCLFLFPPASVVDQMNASLPRWFQLFLGVAEILAAVGLTLPGLARIQPWLVSWAAAGIMIVMISATIYHVARGEVSSAIITAVLLAMATFVAYMRWRVAAIQPRRVA